MHSAHLVAIIGSLPDLPGVYRFYNVQKQIIYIGKAKNLKKRVSSYFNKNHYENKKTAVMVKQISDIAFTIVETETDALLLENSLIKKHQPKFNINLKDDKTYPYLVIKNERFPRIYTTRNKMNDGSEYFGPYASGVLKNTMLDVLKQLFTLRTCNLLLNEANIKALKFKACLEYDIGNCKAPCINLQSEKDYLDDIGQIKNILKGNLQPVLNSLKSQMQVAAEKLEFEKAANIKSRIDILSRYQSKSTIVPDIRYDVDVFSIVSDDKQAYINYLRLSNGIIIQTQTFEIKKQLNETDEEILAFAVADIREKYQSNALEIILPFNIEWPFGSTIVIPKLGDKKRLLDLSFKNALYYKKEKINQYEKLNPEAKTDRILNKMQSDLRLKSLPKHIECFDNSNIQGNYPVSACVVFKDAKPSKSDYRIFNVKTVEGPNDFATMEEVVYRRYRRMIEEGSNLPDLIIIDGGKGQLGSAINSLKKLNIYGKVPVIGIAKRLEELFYPEDELPLYLDKRSETLKIIQQLRDEAHRFGITAHRNKRDKNTLQTELEQIKGIGPETASLLLKTFKSVKKIKSASLESLANAIGSAKATIVYNYFK